MIDKCELCPRRCGKRPGFCGAGEAPRVFRWGPHFGEEPPLTGERGSGCVFFSRCTMKCLYCQNSPWSWRGEGVDKTIPELTAIFRELAVKDRVENWNLVSPTPYLPFIREAVKPLLDEGIRLPFVWNSSGYERVETLEEYKELCDWGLFDLRYSRNETALKASGTPDYVEHARAAIRWAWEKGLGQRCRCTKESSPFSCAGQSEKETTHHCTPTPSTYISNHHCTPTPSTYISNHHCTPTPSTYISNHHCTPTPSTYISNHHCTPTPSTYISNHHCTPTPSTYTSSSVNLIVRILVLPNHADEAIENLAWLATELSNEIPVSIMSQFTPAYKALETPPFNRGVTEEEYASVTEAAADFGFENGWIQGFGAADPRLALLGENMPSDHGVVR